MKIRNRVAFVGGFVVAAAIAVPVAEHHLNTDSSSADIVWTRDQPATERAEAPSRLVSMLASGECWSGTGPEGVIPSHVWIDAKYYGEARTAEALDGLFEPQPYTINAFCK